MARVLWVFLGIGATLMAVNLAPGQVTPATPQLRQLEFAKVISVTCRSDPEHGLLLKDVRLERIGDTAYLVGTGAESGYTGDWTAGAKIDIAMEDVSHILEFNSEEEYQKRIRSK